jgi:hypothetical protein
VIEALAMTVALTVSGPAPREAQQPPSGCKDKTATMLWHAGFKGNKNRIAWAITYRESKHQNLDESSPWYSGALGVWQIQSSAHSGKGWWSRTAMLNPARQSRIVYRYMSGKGRNWSAWGLNSTGTGMDVTQYRGWSSSQHYSWIWAPYQQGLRLYPNKCAQ